MVSKEAYFTKKDSVWQASYVLPADLSLLNVVFESNGVKDNGGEKTYSHIFTSNDGCQASGGMLGWGLLRSPQLVRGVPAVVDTAAYKDADVLLM